jgi:hypothetical protein
MALLSGLKLLCGHYAGLFHKTMAAKNKDLTRIGFYAYESKRSPTPKPKKNGLKMLMPGV